MMQQKEIKYPVISQLPIRGILQGYYTYPEKVSNCQMNRTGAGRRAEAYTEADLEK